MRKLPRKLNERQKLILEAVKDYFGEVNPEERKSITKIALWIMKRRKRLEPLMEEEKEALERIQVNLQDKTYIASLDRDWQ